MAKLVCVTGASGFVASWLVKSLLDRGYTVKATVRDLNDLSKIEHLRSLEGAQERLFLFEANLVEEGSFDAAVECCDGVFHTASPVKLENITDPQKELLEPAIQGTLNVLRSCAKVPSIKRVVLTSSMASVMGTRKNHTPGNIIDETWFSETEFYEETKQWYLLSKTLAEEYAMKFAQENALDLVVINPGLVIGPVLQPTMSLSEDAFLSLIKEGKSIAMPGGVFIFVDVRDVANAHILAFEHPSANGRYCVVEKVVSCFETLEVIHQLYPTSNLLGRSMENQRGIAPFQVSNEKAKSLGVNFTSLEDSVKDTVESFLKRNLISLDTNG